MGKRNIRNRRSRLKFLGVGSALLCASALLLVACHVIMGILIYRFWQSGVIPTDGHAVIKFFFIDNILLLLGLGLVYGTSYYLGIKAKICGLLCCFIPILVIVAHFFIIRICLNELAFEGHRREIAEPSDKCDTRYPVLLLHGIFFKDYVIGNLSLFNYWGRIPYELEKHGAKIFYGQTESVETVEAGAKGLADRIRYITQDLGYGKVNIIAHSKAGLDVKYAIATEDIGDLVASVTTISTPHRGCAFVEYILDKIPRRISEAIAVVVNTIYKLIGDSHPDLLGSLRNLTVSGCAEIDSRIKDYDFEAHGILTRSVGSRMKKSIIRIFPFSLSSRLIGRFDGANDGLVGEPSCSWGNEYIVLEGSDIRGISHGDMVDLTRITVIGFDVRAFYVDLVNDLKIRGL